MLAAASGSASGAASAARTGFLDPANALPWAVPMLLVAPLAAFLLALSSVRTRRSASAMAMTGVGAMVLLTLLVGYALTRKGPSYTASYAYTTLSVAFAGPTNFQTFAVNLTFHVDHLTVIALLAIELCALGALGWHQTMGRSEPGAARFHGVVTALLFALAGVLVSTDLAELFVFWTIAGALTYLLLAHRWGIAEPAVRSRVVLALPFFTDLLLLSGIAWLYSRYGTQDLNLLVPILHTNPGWTVRSLVVAAILLFVGVGGRIALWPFTSWMAQTASTSPPAAVAIVQAMWPIAGIVVMDRLAPIFIASSLPALHAFVIAAAIAAGIAALLAVFDNEPRRVITHVGTAAAGVATAVLMNGVYHHPSAAGVAGVAAMLAIAPARAAGVLAASTLSTAMRTDDLVEMGEAWRRMRASSGALLVAGLVMGLASTGALAYGVVTRSAAGLLLGEAVLLTAAASLRVYFGASFGILRRRRAFDPDRVREPQGGQGWPYWLGFVGAAFALASVITAWLGFLDGQKHPAASPASFVIWMAVAVLGFAACGAAFARGRDGALALSAFGGMWLRRGAGRAFAWTDRFAVAPATDAARRVGDWVPAGDSALARFVSYAGGLTLTAGRAPGLALVLALAVVVAVAFAVAVPGIVK